MPSPSPSVPQPTGNILVNGASSSGSKLPVTTTSGGFITNGIRTIIPSSAGTHSLQNGITRIVTPQGVQFPIGSIPQSNVLQNVVRTGLSGINNILSTGGVTPGIRQATLGTLISGVGANSVAAGSSGANIISSLPPGAGPAMTVNNSGGGATPGQAGQNQTVVLSKGTGVTTMTSTGTIGLSQNPSGGASANNNNVTNNQGQPITLGPGGAGGLQILNMNNLNAARAVNVGAVNSGGTTTHQIVAAGPAGSKNLAPRMIISPQVLNTRPGQPGVDEYQSEFSEFLVPNCKSLSPPNANNGGIIVEEGEDESLSTNCNVIIDTVNGNSPTRIIDYTDQSGQDLGSPTTIRSPQSQSPSSKEPFSQPSTHDVPPCLNVAPHSPRPVVIQSSNNNNDADECGALEDQQNHDVTIVEVVLAHEKQNISCNSRNSNSTNTKYLTEKVSNIAVVDKMNASNDKDDIAFETSSDNGDPESHGDIIYARGEGSQEDSEDVKVLNLEGSPSKVQSKGEEGDESNTSFTAETKHHEENETSGVGSVEGGDNDNANSNFHDDECPIQQRYENPSDNFSDLLFTAPQSSPTKPINRNDEFYPNSSDGDSSTTSIIVHDTPSLAPHSSSISNTNTDKDGVPKKECFYAIGIPRRSSSSSVSSGRDSSPSHSINNIASSDRAAKVSPICHQQEGAFVQPQQHSSGGLSRQTSQEMQFGEIGTHYNVDRNDPTAPGGIFTTDPTLQSQFLHYSQINPVTASVLAPAPVGTFRSEDNNSNNSYAVHTPVIRSNQVAPSTPPSSIKNYNSQSSPKVVDTYTGRNNPVQQHSAYEQDYQGGLTAPSARRLLWSSSSSSQGNLGTLNSSNSGGQLPLSSCEYALNSYDAQSQINTSPSTRMPHHQEYNTYVSRSHQSIPPVPDLSGSFAQQQCHVMGRSSHNTTAPCQSQVPPNRWMSITSGDEGASHITTSNTLGSPSSSSGTQRRTNITEPTPFYNPSHHHHSQPTAHIPRPPYYGTQSLAQRPPPGHHHNMPMNVVRNSVPTNVQISQPPRRRMPSDCVYIDNNQKPSSSSVPTHSSLPPNMTSPYNNNPSAAGSVVVDHSQMPHNTDGFWPVGNHPQQHQQQPQQTVLPNPSYRNQPSSMQNVQQYYPPSHQQQSSKQSSGANYVSNMPNQSGASSSYSHPIVCRVPPIRYNRYPGQATENYPSQQHGLPPQMRYSAGSGGSSNISQQGASNRGSSSGSNSFMRGTVANSSMVTPRPPYNMGYPPRSSPYYPHSLPPNNSGQSFKPQYYEGGGGGGGGESFQGGYSSNFSSCQHDELRRLRPLTLQALPGLPPGASGHLLVKTESGQYQLLRVGMSPAPPTAAATGTTVVPSTVATTTMSIAQQQLLPTSNPPSSSVSTTSATLSLNNNNSNHVVSSSHPLVSTISSSTLQQQPTSVVVSATNTSHSSQLVGKVVVSSTSGISSTNNSMTVVQTPQTIANTTTVVVTTTNAGTPSASKTGTGSSNSLSIPTNPTSPANNRLQSIPSNAANNSTSVVGMASMSMPPQQMYSPQVPQAYSPTFVSASNTANTVSTMTAETAKVKCKNFLSFLLELSAKQNQQVSRNVKALIQGLVDGKVNEENFSDRLQKEVNSQPQPCLVGFLKKSLPHLRHSLATNELKIDGIKPPPLSSVVSPAPVTALIPQHAQIRTPTNHSPPVRIITPINPNSTATPPYAAPVMPSIGTNSSLSFPTTRTTPAPPSTQSKMPSTGKTAKGKSSSSASSSSSTTSSPNSTSGPSKPIASKSSAKDKDKKSFGSSAYSGDDDINDVAAMGGVNLAEESQKILGSTEFVGTQIRSVRDETFLHSIPLQARLKAIAAKHGLAEPPPEVAAIISHATEERLKNLIEKLAVIAEHRLDVIKMDDRYEVTQDVKGQLRFLEELEKLERKRHDEQEREMLIRAAKSRSKSEDPEQAKLKAKAKEMQRVAMEEMRQREANQTALEAIGPRKKPKLDSQSGSQSTISQSPLGGVSASGNRGPQMGMRPRLKRVNTRDLLFLLEQEKETSRSHFLYKNLLK